MGVVACILPWNFPIAVMMRKLAPALITGNTAVLKPSSETPAATLMMGEVFKAIGLPDGVVNIVPGHGNEVGDELSSNPDVNMITLTGSTASGRAVMQAAAQNITKVSLELGGKAPSIVMNDADVDLAVETIFNGKFFNAGQVCTSVERVYVQEEIADIFVSKMTEKICAMTIGDGLAQPAPQMGPLINSQAVDSVDANVKKAVSQGAKVVVGGKRGNSKGCFYQPTLLVDCNHSMDIMHQEIFGPVMPVMRFDTPEQALALANDSEYGLTSVLYTSDFSTAMLFANNIAFGELFINHQQGEALNGYHAGWKKSGTGGDDGKHGMEEFQQTRTVYLKY